VKNAHTGKDEHALAKAPSKPLVDVVARQLTYSRASMHLIDRWLLRKPSQSI